jgi:hypothetical protein
MALERPLFFPVYRSANGANEEQSNLIFHLLCSQIVQRWSIPFLFLATIVLVFYLLCLKIGLIADFQILLSKVGFLLRRSRWCGILSLGIHFLFRASIGLEATPSFGNMVFPAGAESEASTSFPKPEWETALSLPDNLAAQQPLRTHVEGEFLVLFNIGRKDTLSDSTFYNYIKPLALDKA